MALLVVWSIAGCSSPVPAFDARSPDAPTDFSVDVSVIAGRNAAGQTGVHRRTGRFILMADGGLHSDVGKSMQPNVRPAQTRQLDTAQVEAVWRLCQSLGLADPADGQPPINDMLLRPGDGEIVTVATLTGGEERWQFIWRNGFKESTAPAAEQLVRELAALSWMTDEPPSSAMAPIRYEFGPDPYERYRTAPETPAGEKP